MDHTVRKTRRKIFVLVDGPAESGANDMYVADESKISVSSSKGIVCLRYWKKNVIQVQRSFHREYGEQGHGRQTIKRWLKQFQETGSILHEKSTGRPSADANTVEMVLEAFQSSPSKSTLHASRELQVPRSTVQKIPHHQLKPQA
jgi:transposase